MWRMGKEGGVCKKCYVSEGQWLAGQLLLCQPKTRMFVSKAKNSTWLAPATRLVSKMQNLDMLALPQISQLQTMSAKQKTRRGWLQPPDWSAKCKISTRWLCLRLVSSKWKFSRHFNCLPLPLPLPLSASATATATTTATTTTLTATLLLCFCCF